MVCLSYNARLHYWLTSLERLHLPAEIVPATHKKAARAARPAESRRPAPGGGDGAYRAPRGDRDGYRARDDKEGGYRPSYGGAGRGGGAPRE